MSHDSTDGLGAAALVQLAEVKGQLQTITAMIQHNHEATHQRIDDLRHTVETRFKGVDERIGALERNERDTALRTAGVGAFTGVIGGVLVQAGLALIKRSN